MNEAVSLILLAGGKSSRMGENKAFLSYEGQSFIERILENFQQADERIIVANDVALYQYPGVKTLQDIYPNRGPLCGLYTGLKLAKNSTCLVVTVDSPFITYDLMMYLASLSEGVDAVVPKVDGFHHPLCAVYNKSALKRIECAVEEDIRKVGLLLKRLDIRVVGEEELEVFGTPSQFFRNINTQEEYLKVKK